MLYYKLINNNENIVIAVGKLPLLQYVKRNALGIFVSCDRDDKNCFGISHGGDVYSLTDQEGFITVRLEFIDVTEYNALKIIIGNQDEIYASTINNEALIDMSTINTYRSSLIEQLKTECGVAIINGFDLTFNNHTEHFDLTIEDQLNLQSIQFQLLNGIDSIMYHSKGEVLRLYEKDELTAIINKMFDHISYHNNYFNQLKHYVNSLTTMRELNLVSYGMEIPSIT